MPTQLELAGPGHEKRDYVQDSMEVLAFLNYKSGRQYRYFHSDGTPTASLRMIQARLKSGATVQDCKTLIARKHNEWRGDMLKYVRVKTLFGPLNFEEYLAECVTPTEDKC